MLHNSTPQPVSDDEKKVLELESRRILAEGALAAASEGKKKIESDVENMEAFVKTAKESLRSVNIQIIAANGKLLEVENSVREENKTFEEIRRGNQAKLKEDQNELDTLAAKKANLEAEICGLSKKYANDKLTKEGEVADLETKKANLVTEIGRLDVEKAQVIEKSTKAQTELDLLEVELSKKEEQKETLLSSLSSLENEAENQKGIIANNTILIAQQNEELQSGENEIIDLKKKIENKVEEYKALEAKAFALLTKEENLASKEAFIRAKFEKAGIAYE